MTIHINNITKRYSDEIILDDITLKINDGEHIGIVGENGCGKSTFLKILAGKEKCQQGQIITTKNTKIGYLEQNFREFKGSVHDYLMSSRNDILKMQNQMHCMEIEISDPDHLECLDDLLKRYGDLCERFEMAGGYDLLCKVDQMTQGLRIAYLIDHDYDTLSGGEKMRVNLAYLLIQDLDVLLLDEPTNHLDSAGIQWLEKYISSLRKKMIIVSHDRFFLNHTVSKIYEIENSEIVMYPGNYDDYKKEKALRFERLKHDFEEQQKQILKLKNTIRRYRQWAYEGDNESFYRKAKQLEKKLSQIERLKNPEYANRKISIALPACERSSKEVLVVKDLCKRYGDKNLLDHIDLTIYWQDRIALCGDNGSGKSTLIRILMNQLQADEGRMKKGNHVDIGYLPQMIIFNDEKQRLLNCFCYEAAMSEEKARPYLRKFGFDGDDMAKRLEHLSGGERVRLKLAMIFVNHINFIIFDEPTNHLDFSSIEIVESILEEFKGTLLIVSHDRYLIKRLTKRKMILEKGKLIECQNAF